MLYEVTFRTLYMNDENCLINLTTMTTYGIGSTGGAAIRFVIEQKKLKDSQTKLYDHFEAVPVDTKDFENNPYYLYSIEYMDYDDVLHTMVKEHLMLPARCIGEAWNYASAYASLEAAVNGFNIKCLDDINGMDYQITMKEKQKS